MLVSKPTITFRAFRAAARAAIESLDRCIASSHRLEHIEADRPRLGAFGPDPVAERLLGVVWHQSLEFGLRPFMLKEGGAGRAEQRRGLRPRVRGSHVDAAYRLDPRRRRFEPEQARGVAELDAELDAAPELL